MQPNTAAANDDMQRRKRALNVWEERVKALNSSATPPPPRKEKKKN